MRRIGSTPTELSETIYATVVAFFVGHEIGHHYFGHDGICGSANVIAEAAVWNGSGSLESHALELEADNLGATLSFELFHERLPSISPMKVDGEEFGRNEQTYIAYLLSSGLFTALCVLKPATVNEPLANGESHPCNALRAWWLFHIVTELMNGRFPRLDERNILIIAIEALKTAITLKTNSKELSELYDYTQGEADVTALLDAGLLGLIFDKQMPAYVSDVKTHLQNLKFKKKPRF